MIGADVDAVSDAVAPGLALLAHAVAANAMSTNMPRTRTRRGVASARHRVACTVSPTRRPTRPHSANCRPPSLPLNHQLTDRIPDTWTAEPALVAELDLLAERIQGVQRWYTEPVRSPAGWLRTRLADWLDGEGRPRPAHSAELAAAAAEHRRRLAAQRAVADAAATFAASPEQRQAHLAVIRVTLAARRRSA